MKKFRALIIGNDINAYYLARCYHEFTGEKADLLANYIAGEKPFSYTRYTNILNIRYRENLWNEKVFLEELDLYFNEHKKEKILLVSSNETYGEFIAKNKAKLKKKFFFNYPSVKLQHTLVNKEDFYKTYADYDIDLPRSIYYDCTKDEKINEGDITFPVIVKPANVILFKHISFAGKKKIYKLENMEELNDVIDKFKKGNYTDTIIIQEYIPGDDSHLFDAVVYADKNKKVKMVSFAQIGLQEHAPRMIGNAAVIINGYSQYPGVEEQIEKIKKFTEKIGYQGFAEFDMKYDARDGKYKVMEINARQGRCSYYIVPAGFNLIELLYKDLIEGKDLKYKVCNKEVLETFVPKKIVKKYITNEEYKAKVLSMWKDRVEALNYKKDTSFLRKLLLIKIRYNYIKDYKNFKWDWK